MITNKKEFAVFVSFIAVCIVILTINVIINFNYLDLFYVLTLIFCLLKYLYLQLNNAFK